MTNQLTLTGLDVNVGKRAVVRGISLQLTAGRVLGLVGASGSGKTLTARSLLGLVDLDPGVVAGELHIRSGDRDYRPYQSRPKTRRARDAAFAAIRGNVIGYLPQDARAALDPTWTVEKALREAAPQANVRLDDALARAGLHDPQRLLGLYPHELSGGMAQRVVIAQAMLRGSQFLICDEPTTALDPTVQAEIVLELRRLVESGVGLMMITHDLRLLPDFADDVAFIHNGQLVEQVTAAQLDRVASDPARRLFEATRRISLGRLG